MWSEVGINHLSIHRSQSVLVIRFSVPAALIPRLILPEALEVSTRVQVFDKPPPRPAPRSFEFHEADRTIQLPFLLLGDFSKCNVVILVASEIL